MATLWADGITVDNGISQQRANNIISGRPASDAGKVLGIESDGDPALVEGGSGSGLPEVSGSGKALVSVNGEWVEQDGYGYTETTAATVIYPETTLALEYGAVSETSDKEAIFNALKEAYDDSTIASGDTISVVVNGTSKAVTFTYNDKGDTYTVGTLDDYPYLNATWLSGGSWNVSGCYLLSSGSSATLKIELPATSTVHQIDSKYIPSSSDVVIATITMTDQTTGTCSMTSTQIAAALLQKKPVICVGGGIPALAMKAGGSTIIAVAIIVMNNMLMVQNYAIDASGNVAVSGGWYTLTPAS